MSRETKVGFTVTILTLILVVGYLWLTDYKVMKKTHHYHINFKQVGWIKKGDPVTVLGVPQGKVDDIKLYPDSVVVKISIKEIRLTHGTIAYIENQGLIGQMRIALKLGNGTPLAENSTIKGIKKKDLSDIISFLGNASDTIMALMHNAKLASKRIDSFLSFSENEMSFLSKHITKKTDSLQNQMLSAKKSLDTTQIYLRKLLADYDTVGMMLKLSKGSFIKFIQEDSLYRKIDSLTININSLVEDIKKHPVRYLHFSLF